MSAAGLPQRVVFASRNQGKVAEAQEILRGIGILDVVSLAELDDIPDVEETGATFEENALLKAEAAARATGLPAISDDSGLVVDALGGAPGVRSARYAADAGEGEGSVANIARLLRELGSVPAGERSARFVCVAVYLDPNGGAPLVATGKCAGEIARTPVGSGGFGYDPVFYLPELGVTMAELEPAEKNLISHRAGALTELAARVASGR